METDKFIRCTIDSNRHIYIRKSAIVAVTKDEGKTHIDVGRYDYVVDQSVKEVMLMLRVII